MGGFDGAPTIKGIEGLRLIGRGGFALVYRGHQPAFRRDVAVKVLQNSELRDEDRRRFERECQAMGALSDHPAIVTLFDAGVTDDDQLYLVMAFVPGGTLHDQIVGSGPMAWPTMLQLGVRLCGALEAAHRAAVLHRDIKPANVLQSPYGAQLSDFGIARLAGGHETRSGVITASIAHAPPEVLDGDPPTVRADVYSLASTLFTALRGQAAFARDSDSSVLPQIHRILTESPPDLRPSGVPDEVAVILEQAMSKSPDQRPASAAAFGAAMQAIQASLGVGVSELVVAAERATDTPSEPPTAAAVTFPASDSDAKPFEPVAPWSDGVVPPPSAPEPVQPESGPTPDQWWSPVDDRTELASRPGPQPPAPRPPAPQPPAPQPPGPPVSVADVPAASDRSSGRSRKGLVSVGIAAFVVVAVGVGVVATRGGDERPQEAVDDTRPGTDVDTLPGTGADTVASGFTVEPTVVTTEPAVVTTTPGPPIIDELESLGSVAFAADTEVDDLVFSGISALSAGGQDGRYFGFRTNPRAGADLPDSMFAPVVFELDVDIADGALEPGDVSIVGTREVTGPDGEPYGPELDVEGLTQLDDGSFVLVSEHEPGQPSEMFVDHLGSDWTFIDRFALPDWYRSTGDENVGFKAAAAWPGRPGLVIVATEIPVPSDRVAGDRGGVKVARLLAFDVESGEAVAEWGYPLEALDDDVLPEQTDLENVLVELIAVDDSSLLVIERSSSTGTPRLAYYQVDLDDGVAPLVATPPLLEKRLVLDARTGGGAGDVNLQNVAVGPDLADGRSTLITMTDNGFRDQSTLVQALALGTRQ